ncbi:hypothetical protein [Altericroceibacterium endophyticum]|uniref:LPXTG cell wall anchor domain-containing protein n=1 Tax=Altericroceibacterium endophyticum TaxID=1808508 RepID=A0A6I4T8N0_9SPHN|nr:hypothetical protein [Altericroceibacterium endophyticum]MXO66383.1 hypothetical protein [Altericroceibacterium endophyticum]
MNFRFHILPAIALFAAFPASANPGSVTEFRLPPDTAGNPEIQGPIVEDVPAPRVTGPDASPSPAPTQSPIATPTPAPSAAPTSKPSAAPTSQPSTAATSSPRTASSPAPSPTQSRTPSPAPTPAADSAAPAPEQDSDDASSSSLADNSAQPDSDAPAADISTSAAPAGPVVADPTDDAADQSQKAGDNGAIPFWWIIVGLGGLAVILLAFWAWKRRNRQLALPAPVQDEEPPIPFRFKDTEGSAKQGMAPEKNQDAATAQTPTATPGAKTAPAAKPAAKAAPAAMPNAAATAEDEEDAAETTLRLAFEPLRFSLTLINATLNYRLLLSNSGDERLTDLVVQADMISAHASLSQEQQLASPHAALPEQERIARLAPGQSHVMTGSFRLPLPSIRPIRQGDAAMLLLLARFRIVAEQLETPVIQTSVIGQLSPRPGSGLLPIRLDRGPHNVTELAQRTFR